MFPSVGTKLVIKTPLAPRQRQRIEERPEEKKERIGSDVWGWRSTRNGGGAFAG